MIAAPDDINFAELIGPVARHLLGEPNARLSSRHTLRFGTHGSVSVDLAKGVWHDHEAGGGGGTLALIERETKRANGAAIDWLRENRFINDGKPEPAERNRIVATYDYRDANGDLLFQVVRLSPKTFRQRRPDGQGGWTWKLGDARRVLYRFPELLQATAAATVFLVEGEKDADALRDRLLVATTNPGGAGKWRPEYNDCLRGRHVVVLPDNDEAGRDHAQQVAQHLRGVAASVRIVELPGLGPKGDVSDWLAAGGTAEDLEHLAREAPAIEDSKRTGDAINPAAILGIEAWQARSIPTPDRLLGDMLTTDGRVFLVGRTGLGKTLLALAIAAGVASGDGFLHWKCDRPRRVLVIDGEMPARLLRDRLNDAVRRVGPIPAGNLLIYGRDVEGELAAACPGLGSLEPLNTDGGQAFVLRLIDAIGGVDLIVFDNVMSLLTGDQREEISWSAAQPLVAELTRRRIGQLWLDHAGHRDDRQYGSSTKAWRFDAVGILAPPPEEQQRPGETAFTLSFDHPGKARRRTPDNWRDFAPCTLRLDAGGWSADEAEKTVRADRLAPLAREFYRAFKDALARSDTAGRTTRAAWFDECVRLGLADAPPAGATAAQRDRETRKLRKYLATFRAAGLVGVDGDALADLTTGGCR